MRKKRRDDIELEMTLPNQTCYLKLIGRIGEEMASGLGISNGNGEELANSLSMVLTEAASNVIRHANEADPEKKIRIKIRITPDELIVKVFDEGIGFNLDEVPEPEFEPERLSERGRGLFIIRSLMDSVSYIKNREGNVLVMRKKLKHV